MGTQYRSAIFYANEEQKKAAEDLIAKLNSSNKLGAPVITEVEPLKEFYPAEAYHRNYYERNSTAPYCQVVINPKLEHLQKEFAELLKNRGVSRK